MRDLFAKLKGPWTVLHSVSWQSTSRRKNDGEADFVVLHPEYGLLVVEVKGGGIRVQNGQWFSRDRHGNEHSIKNPYEQATASKHALVDFLKPRIGGGFLPAGHAVALPDVVAPELGPAAAPAITWDRDSVANLQKALIDTVSQYYDLSARLSQGDIDRISSLLLPSVTLKPLLRDEIAAADESLTRLTSQQVTVLESLRRNRRAVIYGAAGTGKSVLAVHRALRLAEQGFDVLLTCYNAPLATALAQQTYHEPRVTVRTFHKLCREESERARLQSSGSGAVWWDRDLPAQLPQAASTNGTSFDAIVVDEGQDFRSDWWIALQLLLRDPDEGPFYVFADTQQAIYLNDWEPPFKAAEAELTINCRNTAPIATMVASVFSDTTTSLGADGPTPVFRPVSSSDEIEEVVRRALHRLVHDEGLDPHDIAILSNSKALIERFATRKFGNLTVGSPGLGRITAETIHRFKGLESAAVILVIPPGEFVEAALMYVGLSRGRAYLELIAEAGIGARLGMTSR